MLSGNQIRSGRMLRNAIGALLMLLAFGGAANAAIITVDDTGGADYTRIQDAINNATEGDNIQIFNGTYYEHIDVNKRLNLIGIESPVVDSGGNGSAITINVDYSEVEGFYVRKSGLNWNGGDADSGIKVKAKGVILKNNTAALNKYGFYLFNTANNTLMNNTASNNENGFYLFYSINNTLINNFAKSNTDKGVYISSSSNNSLKNGIISNNNYGLYLHTSSSNNFENTTFISNIYGFYIQYASKNNFSFSNVSKNQIGVIAYSSSNNLFQANEIKSNSNSGIQFDYSYPESSRNNKFYNNIIVNNNGYGIYLTNSPNSEISTNNITNNGNGIHLRYISENSVIKNNSIMSNSGVGLYVQSYYVTVSNNIINLNSYGGIQADANGYNYYENNSINTNNGYGFYISNSEKNILINNKISSNSLYGIRISSSSNSNLINHNSLTNNIGYNVYDSVGTNNWNLNYYSDYTGNDLNNDSIGDSTYYIAGDAGARDDYPLINPFNRSDLGASKLMYVPESLYLYEGYSIIAQSIDARASPKQVWITIYKNGVKLDDVVVLEESVYGYSSRTNNKMLFILRPSEILHSSTQDLVKFDRIFQFSETNGSLLISKDSDLPDGGSGAGPTPEPTPLPVGPPESCYVWDAAIGSNLTFTWTPMNFDGFYYDLDNNAGNESMTIKLNSNTDRTMNQYNLMYSTSSVTIPFKYKPFGNYNFIGFMGEKYLAGYNSAGIMNPSISPFNYHQLHKIFIDDDTLKGVTNGSTLTLNDGYEIKIKDVNITASSAEAWLSVLKDGNTVGDSIKSSGQVFTYAKDVGYVKELPIIAIHIENISRNNDTTIVYLKGIFQISESYSSINAGGVYGSMKITSLSNNEIIMRNIDTTLTLSRDSTVDIMGNLKLKVSDSDVLRFYPYNTEKFERRGTVSTTSNNISVWDALNFAGFFYDLDYGLGAEKLSINTSGQDNRTVIENALVYSTSIQQKPLKVLYAKYNNDGASAEYAGLEGFSAGKMAQISGYYSIIGWQGEPYVAIKAKSNKLSKLLVEHGTSSAEKKTLTVGETWEVGDGWTLTANSIDAKANPRQVWLTLNKDGVKKDDKVVTAGTTESDPIYTYVEKSVAGEMDVPIFVTYVDSIFAGATTDMVQFRYTWLISSNATRINSGYKFGIFNVTEVNPVSIILKNENTVNLTAGNIPIMDTFNISVANSSDLRYYPSKIVINTHPTTGGGGSGGGGGGGEIRYYRIFLQKGWNLISLPLVPLDSNDKENTSIQRITSSISDNIIKIVSYNTTALALAKPPWEVYYPGDEVNSTLKELKTGQGYFIKTNETTFLNIYGVRVYENTPRSYKLAQGWNLMGYPSTSLIPVESALYNIQGDFSSLWMLKNDWRSYIGQQFYYMEPGYGYWIFMKKSGEVPQN